MGLGSLLFLTEKNTLNIRENLYAGTLTYLGENLTTQNYSCMEF